MRRIPLRARSTAPALLIAAAACLLAVAALPGAAAPGIPSPQFWAEHPEHDVKPVEGASGVYQPNTEEDYLKHVHEAAALPETGHAWRNAGPFGGLQEVAGVGDAAGQFGLAGGIGTAVGIDPNDKSGNTAYLGGFGGLYRTTDGGATVKNLTDGKLARYAIGAVAVAPGHPKDLYVGTGVSINTLSDDAVGAGMYVSHDAGKTFVRPARNTHGYGTNVIVVAPNGTVLVGTNYGLWRSTDKGASFVKVPLPTNADHTGPAKMPLGSTVSSIVLNPSSPSEVTVAVGWARGKEVLKDGSVIGTGNGLYRSDKLGAPGSFTFVASTSQLSWPGTSKDPVGRTSLAYANDKIMWALVQDAGRSAGASPADLPSLPAGAQSIPFGGTQWNGLYRSADDGATWTLEATAQTLAAALGNTTPSSQYPFYAAGVQSNYNNWVVADPTDVNTVYIGLEEIYAGTFHDPTGAAGAPSMTWTAIAKYANLCGFTTYPNAIPNNNGVACPDQIPYYGGGTTHPDQHAGAIVKTPSGVRLYSGNDGGWWVQDSHAVPGGTGFEPKAWHSLNKNATVLPWDVAMVQDGSLILALQDNGTIHIRKDGTAYKVCGGDGVIVYPGANAQSYYCGIPGQTLLATTDDFAHTIIMTPTLDAPNTPGITGASFLSPWSVDPTDANHLIAAAGEIAETTAGPSSDTFDPTSTVVVQSAWTRVFTPPAREDKLPWDASASYTRGNVSYVALCAVCRPSFSLKTIHDPTMVHPVIATNVKKGCTAAPAKTDCWHLAAGKGLPHQQISWFAVDPKNPRTIYVGLRSYLVMTANPKQTGTAKVMVSHDAGNSFADISGNLPRVDTHSVALRNGHLYVATDVGIFTTTIGDTTWERFGTGLPQTAYRSMRLDPTGRYLIAGAYGRGAWVYDFGSTSKRRTRASFGFPVPRMPEPQVLAVVLLLAAALMSRRRRVASPA